MNKFTPGRPGTSSDGNDFLQVNTYESIIA
jgi:hypothetical protein